MTPPSHPAPPGGRTPGEGAGVTGVILAGGASRRMGSNKALLPYRGGLFIEAIFSQMQRLFAEVLLVTNHPGQYQFLPCRKVGDLYPGHGPLAGIHAGLCHSGSEAIFVVACDMPYLNPALVERVAGAEGAADVVIPRSAAGLEPLHALYSKRCLSAIEASLEQGEHRIVSFLPSVRVQEIPQSEVAALDPLYTSFSNINTPEQYRRFREAERRRLAGAPSVSQLRSSCKLRCKWRP